LKPIASFVFMAFLLFSLFTRAECEESNFSYESYSKTLADHMNENGRVNYKKLKENRVEFMTFLRALESLERESYELWSQEEKIAFWINAYNALTLEAILKNYPIKSTFFRSLTFPKNSIRQIPGVWDTMTFVVMGKDITLDAIEHGVLREEFQEPRIHMALVCAAKGCPPLRQEPYNGEALSEQLNDQASRFLSDKKNFFIDKKKGVVYLSSIFKWYREDFFTSESSDERLEGYKPREKAVLNFIFRYLSEEDSKFLAMGPLLVKYLKYDWELNEQEEDQ
jgi:hypothetical protein